MASHYPAPDPIQSTFLIPGSNTPGNGVKVFTYTNLSSTKVTVYKDSAGATPHTNPIVLDSGGNLPSGSQVYIAAGVTLTVKYAPSTDTDPPVSVYRTLNDITGVNDVSAADSEWVSGTTPTFVSTTSFTLVGDQTAIYHVGRRVKTTNTGGTIYSRITSSVFTSVTTITVVNDSSVLDSGLSAVFYGLLSSANPSVPALRDTSTRLLDSTDPTKRVAFELGAIQSSTEITLTVQNTTGTLAVVGDAPFRYVKGLIPSKADGGNAFGVSTGVAVSSSNVTIYLKEQINKVISSTWAVSTGFGGLLDFGVMSTNIWYYGYLIKNTTTAWVDAGFSTSATNPTLPTGYTVRSDAPVAVAYIGTSAIRSFRAYELSGGGVRYDWNPVSVDVDLTSTVNGTIRYDTVAVPPHMPVLAHLNVYAQGTTTQTIYFSVSNPFLGDVVPSVTANALATGVCTSSKPFVGPVDVITSSGTVGSQSNNVLVDFYRISTLGFDWSRTRIQFP